MANQYALPRDDRRRREAEAKRKADEAIAEEAYDPKAKQAPKQTVPVKPMGTISAGPGDIRGDIRFGAQNLAEKAGVSRPMANWLGSIGGDVADAIPGLGEGVGAGATGQALDQGNYGKAALEAGSLLLGAVPVVGDFAGKALRKEGAPLLEKAGREALTEAKAAPLLKAAPGTEGVSSALPLADSRIAQRVPTSPTAPENASQNLLINMNVLKSDPDKMKQAADIIATYPGFGSNAMKEMHPHERLDAARQQMTDNLLHLYDRTPPETRGRSSQWYLGANKIANERAAETGIEPASAAGAYAALSPQKDWFMNVDMGDKVLRTLAEDPRITADHLAVAQQIYKPEQAVLLRGMAGKRLSEMAPEEQALAVRLFDEISGKGNRPYRKITPEGDYGDFMMTGKGQPSQLAWQTQPNILKAINAARSGGDRDMLSQLMGDRHKVRNFYNNIVAPRQGEQFGDITADTHQIAASLFRPLGGSSPEVATGLGSGAPSSNLTGMRGLYPIYADATREAAAARGEPVRAMQSIPWEGIRSLFPDTFKTAKNQQIVDDIWRSFDRGEISADQAREHVIKAAGGFRQPTW